MKDNKKRVKRLKDLRIYNKSKMGHTVKKTRVFWPNQGRVSTHIHKQLRFSESVTHF